MTRLVMFFMVKTRLDITFFITIVAYFAKTSNYTYTKTIKTILYYLKKLIDYNITYNGDRKNLSIESYSDSHWAGDKESERLILGFIFMLNRDLVN